MATAASAVELSPKTTAPSMPAPTVTLLPITMVLADCTLLLLPTMRLPSASALIRLLLPNAPALSAAIGAAEVPLLLPTV